MLHIIQWNSHMAQMALCNVRGISLILHSRDHSSHLGAFCNLSDEKSTEEVSFSEFHSASMTLEFDACEHFGVGLFKVLEIFGT